MWVKRNPNCEENNVRTLQKSPCTTEFSARGDVVLFTLRILLT